MQCRIFQCKNSNFCYARHSEECNSAGAFHNFRYAVQECSVQEQQLLLCTTQCRNLIDAVQNDLMENSCNFNFNCEQRLGQVNARSENLIRNVNVVLFLQFVYSLKENNPTFICKNSSHPYKKISINSGRKAYNIHYRVFTILISVCYCRSV